jgi:cytoskeletal protein CcmA (bactofilin family)
MTTPSTETAVFDRHVTVSGKLTGHDLILLGTLDGELTLTGRLHGAAGSRLRAKVQADVVEIEGEFEGEIRATTLRVSASARVRGVFIAGRLAIEEGAVFEGDVQAPPRPVVAGAAADPLPAPAEASTSAPAPRADEPAEPLLDEAAAVTPA